MLFALGLSAGAAVYVSLANEPGFYWLAGIFATSLVMFLLVRRLLSSRPLIYLGVILLMGLSSGVLAGKVATMRVSHPVFDRTIGPIMVEGWVDEIEPARRGVRLRVQVHAIAGLAPEEIPKHVRLTHTTRLEVEAGRFVRCWAVLRPPPRPSVSGDYDFARQAYYEGLGAVGYVQGRCRGGALGGPSAVGGKAAVWIAERRRALAHFVNEAAGERAGGFAAALASGDRSFMTNADKEALRASGLAHLLAISGLHMGIVGGLVFLMSWRGLALIEPLALRYPVQKLAAILALTVSLAYLLLSGASVSTQRAFVMAAVLYGAVIFDRVALSLRSLAIAMIIVVLISPWSVLTPGFQMSFAATGALIATYEAWQRRRRNMGGIPVTGVGFWLKSLFVTSFISGLATMPFAVYHFDRVAALGLGANLLAMPVISLVSAPLAGAALVLSPFGLSEWPLRAFGWSLEVVLVIADTCARILPGLSTLGRPMPAAALVAFTVAMIAAILLVGWRTRFLAAGLLSALGGWIWLTAPVAGVHWAPSGDVFFVGRQGAVTRLMMTKGDGLAPLRYADLPVSQTCEAKLCTYDLEGYRIGVMPIPDAASCRSALNLDLLLLGPAMTMQPAEGLEPGLDPLGNQSALDFAACAVSVASWSDTESLGGQSWRITRQRLEPVAKPACGQRPWAPCFRDAT